jgi:hypothetical protein
VHGSGPSRLIKQDIVVYQVHALELPFDDLLLAEDVDQSDPVSLFRIHEIYALEKQFLLTAPDGETTPWTGLENLCAACKEVTE